ncbi:MAG TPA: hypothetical protein VN668_06220 [Stellaceae bacterium]|nr:hypothetical protein [Stellaceae bacterium]
MPRAIPREALIDEALRRAPAWAQQHLLVALLDQPDADCERCKAATAAVQAVWRRLLLERSAVGPAGVVSLVYPKSANPVRSSI